MLFFVSVLPCVLFNSRLDMVFHLETNPVLKHIHFYVSEKP